MKKLYFLTAVSTAILLASCSDSKNDDVSVERKTMVSKVIYTSFENPSSPKTVTDIFTYDANGNMVKMNGINSDGYSVFEYSADKKINKIIHYDKDNKTIRLTDIFTYQGEVLIKYLADYEDKTSNRLIEYTYDNNGNLKTSTICEGPPCTSTHKTTFSYNGGNIQSLTNQSTGGSYISTTQYTYDNKSNPFINMNKYLRILLSGRYLMNANNEITIRDNYSNGQISYTVNYNNEGFPTKILGKDEKNNNWVQYEYEYIKL
ncbi:hypothetical protein CMU93_00540 [Elizabethkingia anophelis]|nr:hypothetical protein [Elizabethkingia anophelis]